MAEPEVDKLPTVVVDDLHVVYRVLGAKRLRGNAPTVLKRLLTREQSPAIREVHAIRGVSLTAYRGESVGLIGRNGSGKSTLVRAIAGLLPPTSGGVYADGQPSLLGVQAALMNDLTGERNIVLGCLAMGMTPSEVRERYDGIVDFSGLRDFIDLPMRTYSSGMQQRLRFAIAAAKSHDVMLIDEALATGDADFRQRSEDRIRELRSEAGTVFLVSHSLGTIVDTCTRAIWLDEGRIKMDSDVDTVVAAYAETAPPRRRGRRSRKRAEAGAAAGSAEDEFDTAADGEDGPEKPPLGSQEPPNPTAGSGVNGSGPKHHDPTQQPAHEATHASTHEGAHEGTSAYEPGHPTGQPVATEPPARTVVPDRPTTSAGPDVADEPTGVSGPDEPDTARETATAEAGVEPGQRPA